MTSPLDNVCRASIPQPALAALAGLRTRTDVRVAIDPDQGRAWVRWSPDNPLVLQTLLPVPGVVLYRWESGHWYQVGRRLPVFDLPPDEGLLPLHCSIVPAPTSWEEPREDWRPTRLRLERDPQPRTTSALRCDLATLAAWAESATTASLEASRAARSESRVVLLGDRLPPLAAAERFWGGRLLVPLGFRPKPALAESDVLQALEVPGNAKTIVMFSHEGIEQIPFSAFQPLSRASVRLALEQPPIGAHG